MPRLPRSFYETSFFHIICQGLDKSYIFDHKEDIEKYITFMNKLKDEFNIHVIAYCVMNNHVHMLIETEVIRNMSLFMQKLNTKYANYYNKKYQHVGFVFRNRFKSEAIFSESYMYNCINYIFNNPVSANICQNPIDYPYSNIREYIQLNGDLKIKISNTVYTFLDVTDNAEITAQKMIQDFLNKKNRTLAQVSNNNELLKELLSTLDYHNISFRTMEKLLSINRKKLKKILLDDNIIY